jgi:hypothetical protein
MGGEMKLFALVFLLAPLAFAGVIYDFSGTSTAPGFEGGPWTFTYTSPGFVTTDTTVFPGPSLTCSGCSRIDLLPTHPGTSTDSRQVTYYNLSAGAANFFFHPDDFTTLGSHPSFLLDGVNDAILTVGATDGQVPEPSALFLVAGGLAALIARLGRGRAAVRYRRGTSATT